MRMLMLMMPIKRMQISLGKDDEDAAEAVTMMISTSNLLVRVAALTI